MYTMIMILINRNSFEKSSPHPRPAEKNANKRNSLNSSFTFLCYGLLLLLCYGYGELKFSQLECLLWFEQMRKAFICMFITFQLRMSFCYAEERHPNGLIPFTAIIAYTFSYSHTKMRYIRQYYICSYIISMVSARGAQRKVSPKKSWWTRLFG